MKLAKNQRCKDLILNSSLTKEQISKLNSYIIKLDKKLSVIKSKEPQAYLKTFRRRVSVWIYNETTGKESQKQWKKENHDRVRNAYNKWEQSPKGQSYRKSPERIAMETKRTRINKKNVVGHLKYLYQSMRKRQREDFGSELNYKVETLINLFWKQTEKYGMKCPYTGVKMTTIHTGKKDRGYGQSTNISVDRKDSELDYNAIDNLRFVTVDINLKKGACPPKFMQNILNS